MEQMKPNKDKPNKFEQKGERRVLDPVTGQDVIVRDADYQDKSKGQKFSKEQLDPENPKAKGPSAQKPQTGQAISPLYVAPTPAEPGNINFMQLPEIDKINLDAVRISLNTYAFGFIGALGGLWVLTAFRAGWFAFFVRTGYVGALGIAVFLAMGLLHRRLSNDIDRIKVDMHRKRAQQYSPPTPESTEWLNAIIRVAWALVNPEMFVSIADQIEDVMQASLPTFVEAVKVGDMGLGTNPFRFISMRGLPDQMGDKTHPREEWITGDHAGENKSQNMDDNSGDYINLELAFAYEATPVQAGDLRASNLHLMIEFFLGFHDWFHVPVPIWVTVEGIVGTVRLRMQMVPGPMPRNLTFTLMGVPKIAVSVQPLMKGIPNILDLPLISGFVQSSIAAAAAEYVAPKSMTLNLGEMLMGDGKKKDTHAIGVLIISIHHATNLSAQDSNGYSDPYIVTAFSKFGKPLHSTRIIMEDLNPVFEEQAVLLVSEDELKAKEDVSLQLWDSDKRSADDLIGRIQIPLSELMHTPNKMHTRTDPLKGFEEADKMDGELTWSVGYYEKVPLNPKLRTKLGANEQVPKEVKEKQGEEELKPQPSPADDPKDADALTIPPDPKYPSGILSVIIHQINNLERQDLTGASGSNREGEHGQDTEEASEQSGNLPSGYCEFLINDEVIYKTRVKQYTSQPFYEAGTERFIRDYRNTVVRVVVRDSKLREHDPILGIVNLPLGELLKDSSEVTRLYSLQEGVGFGRANISVVFRGVGVELPEKMRGWETGTMQILSNVRVETDGQRSEKWAGKSLKLSTTDASLKLPAKMAETGSGGEVSWKLTDDHLRLPFYNKYSSALVFEVGAGGGIGPIGGGPDAIAALWLRDIEDDKETEVRIPLLAGDRLDTLRQNYINDQTAKTHPYNVVGHLVVTVKLDSGLDEDHETVANNAQNARHAFEAFELTEGREARAEKISHFNDDGVIDKEEKKEIKKAKERELHTRHRGNRQFAPVRTAIWTKDGLKTRVKKLVGGSKGPRQPAVESEA